jgi:hypothetical protein
MKIVLNIIGILIFFLVRLAGRANKKEPLSWRYWIKSNLEQLLTIALFDASFMIFFFQGGLKLNFEKLTFLPDWIQLAGDLATCWLIGLLLSWAGYVGYKKVILDRREKPVTDDGKDG